MAGTDRLDGTFITNDEPRSTHDAPGTRAGPRVGNRTAGGGHPERSVMGQLLAILIIPPLVGVITYAVFRIIWEKDEQGDRVAPSRPLDAS